MSDIRNVRYSKCQIFEMSDIRLSDNYPKSRLALRTDIQSIWFNPNLDPFGCAESEFMCENNVCIDETRVCDGLTDCRYTYVTDTGGDDPYTILMKNRFWIRPSKKVESESDLVLGFEMFGSEFDETIWSEWIRFLILGSETHLTFHSIVEFVVEGGQTKVNNQITTKLILTLPIYFELTIVLYPNSIGRGGGGFLHHFGKI